MTGRGVRASLVALLLTGGAIALAGCQPPEAAHDAAQAASAKAAPVDTAGPTSASHNDARPLPPAVEATYRRLLQLGETGKDWEMAALADKTPGFRSNDGGMSHRAYWNLKLRTGDWPMEHMRQTLLEPHARLETSEGPIYVWPSVAALAPVDITPADVREMDRIAGPGAADAMLAGERWPGYVLGIAEDGRWLFFYSGAG